MALALRVSTRNRSFCPALLAAFVLGTLSSPHPALAQSQNCVLLAHVDSLPGSGSSCWGYVDPNTSKEYAIFGNQNGTAIYNLDNPTQPRLTGFIPGPSSSWREMKTYSTYCYVGTEAGGGMQIINLSNPEAPTLQTTYTGNSLSTIHSVTVDSLTARLYTNGANGGCRILSLANPIAPVQLGVYTAAYVHDSYARNDTLWAACINNGQVRVLNVSNPAAITSIVQFTTERSTTHNCWPTVDRKYLLVTDETTGGRVTSWDIQTLTSPVQVDGFTADPAGDAHNVHVIGNLAYVAHYTSGLQVLDVSDPTNLTRVGYYDTYPSPGGLFNGAWGLYCWFPSTVIVVSDIEGGMFLIDYVSNAGYLRGTVTDANTTFPLANAAVKILQTGVVDSTDALGNYFILHDAGTYDVQASAFNYTSQQVNQTLTVGDTAVVNFALAPVPSGSVSGVFRYAQGAGIPNAVVAVHGTPLTATTDVNGAYSFAQVPEGTYTGALDYWTCIPESAQITVSSSLANSEVNFYFEGVTFAYNMEDTSSAGWAVNVGGGDNATTGIWTRVDPNGTNGGTVQPEDDHTPNPLTKCWVTGQGTVGGPIGDQDVDGGRTTLYSATMDMSNLTDPTIQYFRWYTNNAGSDPNNDIWKVQISSNGGTTWVTTDSTKVTDASWKEVRLRVANYVTPSNQVRMRFIAEDAGSGSIVEAGIDDFRVWGQSVVAVEGGAGAGAFRFALHPNVPNPFNPRTEVRFDLPARAEARLAVYSLEGRLVRTLASGRLEAGPHAVSWDGRSDEGRDVASGIYLLRLESAGARAARKISLVK